MGFSFFLPILVVGVGFYLLIRLRAFFVLHPLKTTHKLIDGLSDRATRRSFSLALAGTLGVGNIFGVAAGIIIGGEGSVFWLFVSSIFASIIKYSEAVLSLDNLSTDGGGMHFVLLKTFSKNGKFFSPLYAIFCLALALFMGASMQSAAVMDVASSSTSISPLIVIIIFVILVAIGVVGNERKIQNITEIVIPMTTIIYIIMALCVIFYNISSLGDVCLRILKDAFRGEAVCGGTVSFLFSRAFTEGFARGILSNEAGAGTSSMAHSLSHDRSAASAGLFGMCEVLFDTVVLCMLTAIAILVAVDDPSAYHTPMSLVFAAFSLSLGKWSGGLLICCVFAFAYSTVICWYYYGISCYDFLLGGRLRVIYSLVFFIFVGVGAFIDNRLLLSATDLLLLLMSLMTLSAVLKRADRIVELTKKEKLL